MNILITGGTGFVGSRLALKCCERGDSVTVLGQENSPAESENCKLLERSGIRVQRVSITEKEKLPALAQGIDLVYHLAAAQHEANVPDQRFWDVNVTGTRNLLEASVAGGVKRFVHGSTIGVYGLAQGVIDEHTPTMPDNIYGVTKLEGEKVVLSFRDKIPIVIVRISETYGPGDRRLVKLFKAIEKNVFFIIGSGQNLHHLLYIEDLLDGLLLAATVKAAVEETFLLAGKEAVTTRKMATIIADELGVQLRRFRAPLTPFLALAIVLELTLRPLGVQPPLHRRRMDFFRKSFSLSHEHATKVLGYTPKVGVKEGMAATALWYGEKGYLQSCQRHEQGVNPMQSLKDVRDQESFQSVPTLSPEELTARIEPFDSFWEGPENVEKGYPSFYQFYKWNYLRFMPPDKDARILVVSCGPGYFVNLLDKAGYRNVLGIDSDSEKVSHARKRNLNCRVERAFTHLTGVKEHYDVIFCEQELNHLTKEEMLIFLRLCREALNPGGTLIAHGLNGANPITGAEALAQNFDHYNTFTEYTLRQVLKHCQFSKIQVIPLNLYVFYKNPLNYALMLVAKLYSLFFTFSFMLYGKANRIWTKKIAAVCRKPA